MTTDTALAFITIGMVAGALWSWRFAARKLHERRLGQLERSAELLDAHAAAMGRFLERETSPPRLKRLLITCSDAFLDRGLVSEMARLMARRHAIRMDEMDEEVTEAVTLLRRDDPDALADFTIAATSGVLAAVLRWPESAGLFEQITALLVADPRHDVDLVVTTSRFSQLDPAFGGIGHGAAMA